MLLQFKDAVAKLESLPSLFSSGGNMDPSTSQPQPQSVSVCMVAGNDGDISLVDNKIQRLVVVLRLCYLLVESKRFKFSKGCEGFARVVLAFIGGKCERSSTFMDHKRLGVELGPVET